MAQNSTATDQYMSVINSDSLIVPVKAATVYAAHEASLFLGGNIIPVVNAPNGVLQVPELTSVDASKISTEADPGVDVTVTTPGGTKNTIVSNLYAARTVLRDLGAVDPSEIGRVLGNAVAKKFDLDVMAAMASCTEQENAESSRDLTVKEIMRAIGNIRANGETGKLFGLVNAAVYAELMDDIGSQSFAGGKFQDTAMDTGFLGTIAGVDMFVTSYLTDANVGLSSHNVQAAVFSADAFRIGMQKNVDVEIARRAEAVGSDVVASLHAGVAAIDAANRGVLIIDENA
jgi:hypothetical protein|tara:strand:- start:274 stop:1137 length:864 start_codon:yes stop_codon:yes gene_type:complete